MASRDLDRAIAELAVRQQNVFARWQAIELGATRSAMQRRIDAGHWVVVAPGVYALPAPATFLRRIWIGHLAAGPHSLVSHQTAGALSEFVGCPKREVILTVPHSGWHRIEGVFVHQISDVLPHHRTTFSGLPITTRARTLVDLATVFRPAVLGTILDNEVTHRNVTYVEVGRCLQDVTRRGKPGVRRLTAVLDARGPGHVPPASVAERLLMEALQRAWEPEPRRQFPFPGRQFTAGCVDSAYVQEKLIIEVDSRSWDARIADLKRDHARDAEALTQGWATHRPLAEDIKGDPEGTVATIREIRLSRAAQLHPNSTQ